LRQLKEEHGDGFTHLAEAHGGEGLVAGPDGDAEQPVQALASAFLVGLQVAGGMEGDGPAGPAIRVDTERRLLGHGPGGKEQRRLHTEERCHLLLKFGDDTAEAVDVGIRARGDRGKQLTCGAKAMAAEEPRARPGELLEVHVSRERGRERLRRGRPGLDAAGGGHGDDDTGGACAASTSVLWGATLLCVIACAISCATRGLAGVPVTVEADIANGLPIFSTGLLLSAYDNRDLRPHQR